MKLFRNVTKSTVFLRSPGAVIKKSWGRYFDRGRGKALIKGFSRGGPNLSISGSSIIISCGVKCE